MSRLWCGMILGARLMIFLKAYEVISLLKEACSWIDPPLSAVSGPSQKA